MEIISQVFKMIQLEDGVEKSEETWIEFNIKENLCNTWEVNKDTTIGDNYQEEKLLKDLCMEWTNNRKIELWKEQKVLSIKSILKNMATENLVNL